MSKIYLKKGLSRLVSYMVLILVALFFVTIFDKQASAQAKKVYTLKSYYSWIPSIPIVQLYFAFLDDLEKKSGGEIKIKVIGGPESIAPAQALTAARKGIFDIGFMSAGYYMETGALLASMAYPGPTAEIYGKSGANKIMDQMFQKKFGMRWVSCFGGVDSWVTFSKVAINKADYSGLKVRIFPLINKIVKALNGVPVTTAAVDRYTALERGVVDAVMTPVQDGAKEHLYEAAKYVITPGMLSLRDCVWMNGDSLRKLPPHLQELIMKLGVEWEIEGYERQKSSVAEAYKTLTDNKMKRIDLSSREAAKFTNTSIEVFWKTIKKLDPIGVDVLKPRLDAAYKKLKK